MASHNHIGDNSNHLLLNGYSHSASDTPSPTSANRSRADPGTPNPTPVVTSRDPVNGVTTANHLSASNVDFQVIAEKLHNLATEDYNNLSPNRSPRTQSESHSTPRTRPTSESQCENAIQDTGSNISESTTTVTHEEIVVMKDEFNIQYERYQSECQMGDIMGLISKDLSEPYSIYTYRYFIHNWPNLCFLAKDENDQYIGAIVCKLDMHKRTLRSRGYIAMLAVHESQRRKKIGTKLVGIAIDAMIKLACDEIVLEAVCTNIAALGLYEQLGFIRDKRLHKYYLNGLDAFRLKLWIT